MRIIGGKFRGRRFTPPADKWPTRPTTDQAKEGLFNILMNRVDFSELKVLDLFGGTGSHCYEFVSRGCEDVTYVDKHAPAVRFVRRTISTLDIEKNVHLYQMDVFKFIGNAKLQYDYIFAGPPYDLGKIDIIPDLIFKHNLLKEDGLFVMEHNPNHEFLEHPHISEVRNYGKTIFSFFKNIETESTEPTESPD